MLTIGSLLPGELEGEIDPGDYGFGVIKDDDIPSADEVIARKAEFYRRAKERTGMVIPVLEKYLVPR